MRFSSFENLLRQVEFSNCEAQGGSRCVSSLASNLADLLFPSNAPPDPTPTTPNTLRCVCMLAWLQNNKLEKSGPGVGQEACRAGLLGGMSLELPWLCSSGAWRAACKCHRSHFGSRYKLGCCGHAGLFDRGFEPGCDHLPSARLEMSQHF